MFSDSFPDTVHVLPEAVSSGDPIVAAGLFCQNPSSGVGWGGGLSPLDALRCQDSPFWELFSPEGAASPKVMPFPSGAANSQ